MRSITRQKDISEIAACTESFERLYILGCGTCATVTETGGVGQVQRMRDEMQQRGKWVTGWAVLPTACDEMAEIDLRKTGDALSYAECVLVMACALGVQRIGAYVGRPAVPALDTMFIGLEQAPGHFEEVCRQCGQCILGETAGICPVTACHKGLLNGPCGGTDGGKCEVDPDRDCAYTLIYQRLEERDQLHLMHRYRPPRDHHVMLVPRMADLNREVGDEP